MLRKMFTSLFFIVFIVNPFISAPMHSETKDKVKIRVFYQMSQPDSSLMRFIEQYNQSQDQIELELDITTAGCSFDAADTLLKRIADGNPPDITFLKYRELWDHYLDLTGYLSQEFLSGTDTTMFPKFRINNRLIFLPLLYGTRLFYYNKKMFNNAGIPYPPHQYNTAYADGETWDVQKLEKIAMLLTKDSEGRNANDPEFDSGNIVQYGFHWGWFNGIGMIQMFGPPQVIQQNNKVVFPDYSRFGFHWSHEGIWKKHFIPADTVFVNYMNEDPICTGKCAMMYSYEDYANQLMNSSVDWDIAAVPSYNGTHNLSWAVDGFAILKESKHPVEAIKVITDIANMPEYYVSGFSVPLIKNLRENISSLWADCYPDIDKEVVLNGLDYKSSYSDGEAVNFQMEVWSLINDYRSYLRENSDADVDGALDNWLIPEIEKVLSVTSSPDIKKSIPVQNMLYQNYPNPFNPATTIRYNLPQAGHVSLEIYNLLGQKLEILVKEYQTAGEHQLQWKPEGLASGIYVVRLRAGSQIKTMKLVLQK